MSNCEVKYYWAVPKIIWDDIGDSINKWEKELVNLTWSATVLEIGWKRFLIDLWAFQWTTWSELFNSENIWFLNNLDWVYLTHSHIDHVWRLPLLYKNWYTWKIYMTTATKHLSREMLLDSVKIQISERDERLSKNESLWNRLREAIKIIDSITALEKNNFQDNDTKSNIKKYLVSKLWEWYDYKDILKQTNEYLEFYQVKEQSDIAQVIQKMWEILFTNEDVEKIMSSIETVDYDEEKILYSKTINSINKNTDNQDILENLPEKVANWFSWEIFVNKKSEKRKLKQKWEERLKQEIKVIINSWENQFNTKKTEFKKNLEKALTFCEKYKFLESDRNETKKEYKHIKKELVKHKKYLKNHWIINRNDIDKVINSLEKLIDEFRISIPYNSADIKKAFGILQIRNEKTESRQIIWLTASDAAHVVWSSSILFTSWVTKNKIKNLLDINWDAISVFFSWDLWKIEDNRLWRPELPSIPVDYLQIESTYGGKNHRNRKESVKELIDLINNSEGNVLISVFSQQRTQEILLTILEEKVKHTVDFLDYDILVDAPLAEKLTNIYFKYKWEVYNLLDKENQENIFWKQIFRFLLEEEWRSIYSNENPNKKHIILSSSWMMDWWAIMNHLPNILPDEKATLIAPWYLSRWTIWNEIVMWDKESVTINWESIKISCNKKYVDWFSAHIWHNDILQYITEVIKTWKLKKWSTIALTHWNIDWQQILKSDLLEILKSFNRNDIKVVIPELFSTYDINSKWFSKNNTRNEIVIPKKTTEEVKTPNFLLKKNNIDEDKNTTIDKVNIDKNTDNINHSILKNINYISINNLKKKWDLLETSKSATLYSQFELLLKNNSEVMSKINKFFSKIELLNEHQKISFYNTINGKITKSRELLNRIKSLKDKIKEIENLKENIFYIVNKKIPQIKEEVNKIENKINLKRTEKENYEVDFNLFKQKHNFIKSNSNKTEWEFFEKSIKSKNKKIWESNKKVKSLNYIIKGDIDDLKSNILVNLNTKFKSQIDDLFENSIDSENLIDNLLHIFIDDIYEKESEIKIIEWELKSHIEISFNKSESSFWWENLYNELVEKNNWELNEGKLQDFIDKWKFTSKELLYINLHLNNLNHQDTRKKLSSNQKLKNYFRWKQKENENLWIDVNLSLSTINKKCLSVLESIFVKDYYNNYVSIQFDIYLFIKSKKSFKEYITSKFRLEKLKWVSDKISKYDEIWKQLQHFSWLLDWLLMLNTQPNWVITLEDINFWIYCTNLEIDKILNWIENI